MSSLIEEYLDAFKSELRDGDRAVVQDALADAEEHLRTALSDALLASPGRRDEEVWPEIVEKFGTPAETAAAYKDAELRPTPLPSPPRPAVRRPLLSKYFSVVTDPKAWGAFIYALFSLVSGFVYFGWTLAGGSISLISLIFVIGVPVTGLFLLSLRGIAHLEGRIVEALLGVRMPRRPVFVRPNLKPLEKFRILLKSAQTWKILAYLVLKLPLGFIYFAAIGGMFIISLSFILAPILELVLHLPLDLMGDGAFTPPWLLPFICLAGFALLPATLLLAKRVGKLYGRYAKFMLVSK